MYKLIRKKKNQVKMNETSKICQVCIEPFNKSGLKEVECPYCEYSSCAKCVKSYMKETKQNAHCMNCRREWDRDIMVEKLTKSYVNKEWKNHREEILLERETSLLPETQVYVEREIEIERLVEEHHIVQKEISKWILKSIELKKQIEKMRENKEVERRQFTKKCPNGDCRGFLSTKWKCGLCEVYVCVDCHEMKGENHECKEENVETAKMMTKECKSCPKCATMIYKIDGCDLMWCVMCHTAFSWKTGRIESGENIHNPHYFEWLRQNGREERNVRDIQCGREIDNQFVRQMNRELEEKMKKSYLEKARKVIHIRQVEMRRYETDNVEENRDLRVSYMRGKITKEEWKKVLQKREKCMEKKRNIRNVMGMYVNTMTDIMYRIMETKKWEEGIEEMEKLREYVIEQYKKIKNVYGMSSITKLVEAI